MSPLHRLLMSTTSAAVALSSAGLLAHELQTHSRALSHELAPWTGLPVPPGSTSATLRVTGRKLFLTSCAHCHGADARGDEGPDLHALEVSDRRIATVVGQGIKGEMPSYAKKHSSEEIAALIAYLRTLE